MGEKKMEEFSIQKGWICIHVIFSCQKKNKEEKKKKEYQDSDIE